MSIVRGRMSKWNETSALDSATRAYWKHFTSVALGALLASTFASSCSDNDYPLAAVAGGAGMSHGSAGEAGGGEEAGARSEGGGGSASGGSESKAGSPGGGESNGGGTSGSSGTSGAGTSGSGGTPAGGASGAGTGGGGTSGHGGTSAGGMSGAGTGGAGVSGGGTSGAGTGGAGTGGGSGGSSGAPVAGTSGGGVSGGGTGGSSGAPVAGTSGGGGTPVAGTGGGAGAPVGGSSGNGGSSESGGTAGNSGGTGGGGAGISGAGTGGGGPSCPSNFCSTPYVQENCGAQCEPITSAQCVACEAMKGCNVGANLCSGLTANADGGSAQGTPRAQLCNEALDCLRTSGCSLDGATTDDVVIDCYCGSVAVASCTPSTANGPCRVAFERSLETSDLTTMMARITDQTYGGGRAFNRSDCDLLCPDAGCFKVAP